MRFRNHKSGDEKRHIIVVGSAIAVLAVLVVIALIRRPVMIMPPESDEITAKRQSPDNAFYTLQEAIALLPDRPEPLMVETGADTKRFVPDKKSWGRAFNVRRPDDDPLFVEYRQKCVLAVRKAREALTKPYFLYPEIGIEETFDSEYYLYLEALYELTNAIVASARYQLWTEHEREQVTSDLLDWIRLGRMVARDGSSHYHMQVLGLQQECLRILRQAVSQTDSAEVLHNTLLELQQLADEPQYLSTHLVFEWRQVDNSVHSNSLYSSSDFSPGNDPTAAGLEEFGRLLGVHNIGRHYLKLRESRRSKRQRKFLRKNRDELMRAVDLPYREYIVWKSTHRELPGGRMFHWQTVTDTYYHGSLLAIALELYRIQHGEYPEELDALVPEQIGSLPLDPFNGGPFDYRRVKDDYLLRSIGPDLVNDPYNTGDIVIHQPADDPSGPERV